MSIILKSLDKRYGDNLVVKHVSLEIPDGELLVLLGASGSGKSTVLRMIAGLIQPDGGSIELNGRDVTYLLPQARNVGFVFQNYSIFRHMTVAENVVFGLRVRKKSAGEQRQRAEELLDLVGLGGLGGRFSDQLSGGQLQRVALARALAYDPAVLLLDEPFGALDVKIRTQLRLSLKNIQRRLNVTTILVTHDQEEAFELADRIGVMERGALVEVGTPSGLYHTPRTEFAATFVGGGNVLVGRMEQNRIRLGSVLWPMPTDAPAHEDRAPVRILFRPETVLVQSQPFAPESGIHTLGMGRVVEQTFAGSMERSRFEVEGLRGSRPLAPPLQFGQTGTQVHVTRPSNAQGEYLALGREYWLGVADFHVLEPSGLKMLVAAEPGSDGIVVARLGGAIALATAGPVTLLASAADQEEMPQARELVASLQRQMPPEIAQLDLSVRLGDASSELVAEAYEGNFELILMSRKLGKTDSFAIRTTLESGIPVLLSGVAQKGIARILICTAGGEPGKTDIAFGGRLARRLRAEVTLLHIRRPDAGKDASRRIDRHLQQGLHFLQALGISARSVIRLHETAATGIIQALQDADYDLIVLGAPAAPMPQQMVWRDFAAPVIDSTDCSVLIVPMQE